VADQHTIAIDGNAAGVALSFTAKQVRNLTLSSAIPIKLIDVTDWLDTDATADAVTAPSVATLKSKGDFAADLTLTNAGAKLARGAMPVGGRLTGSTIRAAASVGAVTLGQMIGSSLFVATRADLNALPTDAAADFLPVGAGGSPSIKSLTIKGVKN